MAKPIKITPVVRGCDAITLYRKLEDNKSTVTPRQALNIIRESALSLRAISKRK